MKEEIRHTDFYPIGSKAIKDGITLLLDNAACCENLLALEDWKINQPNLAKKICDYCNENGSVSANPFGFWQGVTAVWLISKLNAENRGMENIPEIPEDILDQTMEETKDCFEKMKTRIESENKMLIKQLTEIWSVIPHTREQWMGACLIYYAIKKAYAELETKKSEAQLEELLQSVDFG